MTSDHDPLLAGLAAMAVPAPGRLLDTVAGRWTRVSGPAGDVYVAATDLGVAYLRTAGSAEEFAGLFRARFGRPLLPAARPPAGLLTAHRHGFASLAAAGRSGFRPCQHCMPVLQGSPLRKQFA
jgi:hypothetical protein